MPFAELVYGIRLHHRRWLALQHDKPQNALGWVPFKWTKKLDEAEKFGSPIAAKNWLEQTAPRLLSHDGVSVSQIIPGRGESAA